MAPSHPPGAKPAIPEKVKQGTNVLLAPGDQDLLDFICEQLGVRRGEGIRTAIRVYAAILVNQQKRN